MNGAVEKKAAGRSYLWESQMEEIIYLGSD